MCSSSLGLYFFSQFCRIMFIYSEILCQICVFLIIHVLDLEDDHCFIICYFIDFVLLIQFLIVLS